jgi:hypothetical protein
MEEYFKMAFNLENGFTPNSFEEELQNLIDGINAQFNENYVIDTFRLTDFYRIAYPIIQYMLLTQNNIGVLLDYYERYIKTVDDKITRPITTNDGVIDYFDRNGYHLSYRQVKDPTEAYQTINEMMDAVIGGGSFTSANATDAKNQLQLIRNAAGNMFVCVMAKDGIEYNKETVAKLMNDSMSIGNIYIGSESQSIILNNGLLWTFSWELPTQELLYIKAEITLSRNKKSYTQDTDSQLKQKIIDNIRTRCLLGQDFEPDSLLQIDADIPYASDINVSWRLDPGDEWSGTVKKNDYNIKEYTNANSIDIDIIPAGN